MSRRVSRKALEPSPRVIRPATSTTLTSPTCLVFNFMLTDCLSCSMPPNLLRHQIFHQSYFGPARIQMPHLELIHKRTNEENAPSRSAHDILRRQRVGEGFEIETLALVGYPHREPLRVVTDRKSDLLMRVIPVSMDHRVDHGLTYRHPDPHQIVLV